MSGLPLTLLAAIIVLGVLIFVHELGHFLAAKAVGIQVLRFSFGLGSPTPLKFKKGETEYCISWIPLGGYVKMAGLEEDAGTGVEGGETAEKIDPSRTFDSKPLWARTMVISAGVTMNALFAVLVYAGLTWRYGVAEDPTTTVGEVRSQDLPMGAAQIETLRGGDRIIRIDGDTIVNWRGVQEAFLTSNARPMRIDVFGDSVRQILVDIPLSAQEDRLKALRAIVPWHDPIVGDVMPGRPAARAGFQRGDRIVRIGADSIPAWEKLVDHIESSPGQSLQVAAIRNGQPVSMTLVPESTTVGDTVVGKVGIGVFLPVKHYGFVGSLGQGVVRAAEAGGLILFTLKGLITGQLSPRDLGGPILVGQLSGEAVRLGIDAFLGFMALFSMNLAVLNLLPIPVLDGGHLLFLLIEGIRRKPLSLAARQRFTQIGFFVLVAIMILALANDFTRLFQRIF